MLVLPTHKKDHGSQPTVALEEVPIELRDLGSGVSLATDLVPLRAGCVVEGPPSTRVPTRAVRGAALENPSAAKEAQADPIDGGQWLVSGR